MDSAQRMMIIQMELDSRKLGGSALLIPFAHIHHVGIDHTLAIVKASKS